MADLTRSTSALAYALSAPLPTESTRAVGAVALDWRRTLDYLVTARTLEQRDLHPRARAHRAGERDLTRGLASGTQEVAGSGPRQRPTLSASSLARPPRSSSSQARRSSSAVREPSSGLGFGEDGKREVERPASAGRGPTQSEGRITGSAPALPAPGYGSSVRRTYVLRPPDDDPSVHPAGAGWPASWVRSWMM